jgi:hypothetical protein
MTHIALSCAILLGLMRGDRPERRVLETIKAFIDVLSSADADSFEDDGFPRLTTQHASALELLNLVCSTRSRPETPPRREKSGAEDDGFVPNKIMNPSGPTELPSQLQIEDLSRNPTDESTIDWYVSPIILRRMSATVMFIKHVGYCQSKICGTMILSRSSLATPIYHRWTIGILCSDGTDIRARPAM